MIYTLTKGLGMLEALLSEDGQHWEPVGPFRYVRLSNMRHPANGGQSIVAIASLRIIDTRSGTDHALNKAVSGYSQFSTNYQYKNAVDASVTTLWISASDPGVLTEMSSVWFQVDLGEPREFDSILISGRDTFGQVPGKFDILGSVDGSNWALLRSLTEEVTSAFGNLTEVLAIV